MEQKKVTEFYEKVDLLMKKLESLVDFMFTKLYGKKIDEEILNLDLLNFLLYLSELGNLNKQEIQYIQKYIDLGVPSDYWVQLMSDLGKDIINPQIPELFDFFVRFDNKLYQQGLSSISMGPSVISIFQMFGLGFLGADGIVCQGDLDKLEIYVSNLTNYYVENILNKHPILDKEPISHDLVRILSYNMSDKNNVNVFDINFLGKSYHIPKDAAIFVHCGDSIGLEMVRLIQTTREMIIRYSETDSTKFFENFDVEIKKLQETMADICKNVIEDLNSYPNCNVYFLDFYQRFNEIHEVEKLGSDAAKKAISESKKIVREMQSGMRAAHQAAASTITGSNIRVFTSSLSSLLMSVAIERHIMISQAKKADKQYEQAVKKIEEAGNNVFNRVCTNILISDFGHGLVRIIDRFYEDLKREYIIELAMSGNFELSNIADYNQELSNMILNKISKSQNKYTMLIEAYEACPFNLDVYEKALELGCFDVDTMLDAKKVFPIQTLQEILKEYIQTLSGKEKEIDGCIQVITEYFGITQNQAKVKLHEYFAEKEERELAKKEQEEAANQRAEQIMARNREIEKLKQELAKTGFFAFDKKKALKEKIANLQKELANF